MMNIESMDRLLKQAFSPTIEPSEELNNTILKQIMEYNRIKKRSQRRIRVALIVALITVGMSITTFAAWYLLNPKQIAQHFEDKTLTRAFESKDAIEVNQTVASGEYKFTFLGVVSGEGLSDSKFTVDGDVHEDRTYAVVSIEKEDGSPMPDTHDEAYGQVPFFISPLIKGQKPWQVNIASMNGGYSDCVIEGVLYRLLECDGVEIFADRGLYLAISTSPFYDSQAFDYDEKTGEVHLNTSYKGAHALFDLPLDKSKADHEKAEKYLKELLKEPEKNSIEPDKTTKDWEKEVQTQGILIPESVKEVTLDEDHFANYEYKGHKVGVNLKYLFEEEETNVSRLVSISGDEDGSIAIQFYKDDKGIVIGRALKLDANIQLKANEN